MNWLSRIFRSAVTAALFAAVIVFAPVEQAAAEDLSGSWRGGGSVSFLGGKSERANCRASYSRAGANSYAMSATCATASGSVSQSAIVRKAGGNSYRGGFTNSQYDATGSISVTVSGRSQSVYVSSNKGSASMRLSR